MSRRWSSGLLGIVLAFAACGIPSQDAPHVMTDATLPREPTTAPPDAPAVVDTPVYFIRDDKPVAVARRASGSGIDDVLDALLKGPADVEISAGLRTALPVGARIRIVDVTAGVAQLDVGSLLDGVTGQEQILVFAQLVLTATSAGNVGAVAFTQSGRRIDAPLVDGTLVSRPVTAADYARLITE